MNELSKLLKQNPSVQSINLEFSEIESLDPLVPLLIRFPDLKELLLFGNRLETLPKDLSKLKFLETLDISNNLIETINPIIPGLKSLPKLKELHITLQSLYDEQLILTNLPFLLNLNGNPTKSENSTKEVSKVLLYSKKAPYEDDEIEEFPNEEHKPLLLCESSGFFEQSVLDQNFLEKIAELYDEIRSI